MLTKIEARNYRALRYISQTMRPYQVLIGPNASGKSTFLDVVEFIADLVIQPTLQDAVRKRASDLRDLTWMRDSEWLELAVEAEIPESRRSDNRNLLRYEVRIGIDPDNRDLMLPTETLWLLPAAASETQPATIQRNFPTVPADIPERITRGMRHTQKGWRKVVNKVENGNDYFQGERTKWNNMFRLGPKRSALANLPEDEDRFPAATWFKRYIGEGVQRIMLNSEALREASPPQSPRSFLPDGSNLPWVIHTLEQSDPAALQEWVEHLQTALPDVTKIDTIERPEDRHRYLRIHYDSGLVAPSWVVSDGTLRMLALTILAYLPDANGIYLIEEPENGIHPQAVETVVDSLRSVYDGQVLLASHSPIVLSMSAAEDLLCFARTAAGEVDVVNGDRHPKLQDWRQDVNLSTLFASGVLSG